MAQEDDVRNLAGLMQNMIKPSHGFGWLISYSGRVLFVAIALYTLRRAVRFEPRSSIMEGMKKLRDDFEGDVPKTVEELTCECPSAVHSMLVVFPVRLASVAAV